MFGPSDEPDSDYEVEVFEISSDYPQGDKTDGWQCPTCKIESPNSRPTCPACGQPPPNPKTQSRAAAETKETLPASSALEMFCRCCGVRTLGYMCSRCAHDYDDSAEDSEDVPSWLPVMSDYVKPSIWSQAKFFYHCPVCHVDCTGVDGDCCPACGNDLSDVGSCSSRGSESESEEYANPSDDVVRSVDLRESLLDAPLHQQWGAFAKLVSDVPGSPPERKLAWGGRRVKSGMSLKSEGSKPAASFGAGPAWSRDRGPSFSFGKLKETVEGESKSRKVAPVGFGKAGAKSAPFFGAAPLERKGGPSFAFASQQGGGLGSPSKASPHSFGTSPAASWAGSTKAKPSPFFSFGSKKGARHADGDEAEAKVAPIFPGVPAEGVRAEAAAKATKFWDAERARRHCSTCYVDITDCVAPAQYCPACGASLVPEPSPKLEESFGAGSVEPKGSPSFSIRDKKAWLPDGSISKATIHKFGIGSQAAIFGTMSAKAQASPSFSFGGKKVERSGSASKDATHSFGSASPSFETMSAKAQASPSFSFGGKKVERSGSASKDATHSLGSASPRFGTMSAKAQASPSFSFGGKKVERSGFASKDATHSFGSASPSFGTGLAKAQASPSFSFGGKKAECAGGSPSTEIRHSFGTGASPATSFGAGSAKVKAAPPFTFGSKKGSCPADEGEIEGKAPARFSLGSKKAARDLGFGKPKASAGFGSKESPSSHQNVVFGDRKSPKFSFGSPKGIAGSDLAKGKAGSAIVSGDKKDESMELAVGWGGHPPVTKATLACSDAVAAKTGCFAEAKAINCEGSGVVGATTGGDAGACVPEDVVRAEAAAKVTKRWAAERARRHCLACYVDVTDYVALVSCCPACGTTLEPG